jgi:hypothetical protein
MASWLRVGVGRCTGGWGRIMLTGSRERVPRRRGREKGEGKRGCPVLAELSLWIHQRARTGA